MEEHDWRNAMEVPVIEIEGHRLLTSHVVWYDYDAETKTTHVMTVVGQPAIFKGNYVKEIDAVLNLNKCKVHHLRGE